MILNSGPLATTELYDNEHANEHFISVYNSCTHTTALLSTDQWNFSSLKDSFLVENVHVQKSTQMFL